MATVIIDPRDERYALTGRIVTMNDSFDVLEVGTVYIHNGKIEAVHDSTQPPPAGFENCPVVQTNGTIFPGLIELHNHLSYNVLPMWRVPEKFEHRGQWRDHPDKRRLVTAPMFVLGRTPTYAEAVVRYVECKCLVSGVTTSQGISLYGVQVNDYYRGVVRNVEMPTDPRLPKASTKISDVTSAEDFWKSLQNRAGAFLLHLSEGVGAGALKHFKALQMLDQEWAISDALAGIHATALRPEDFDILAARKGAIIWSPLSNLLLYGGTTNVRAATEAGVTVALGSDWSPSGSKNLLCELKVARIVAEAEQIPLQLRDIVAMVTRNPAKILKWGDQLGSIEAGKQADLIVIRPLKDDPYEALIAATELEVELVVINCIPRYGSTALMQRFTADFEAVSVGGEARLLNLWEEGADPAIVDLTLAEAASRLQHGLANLVPLAQRLEDPNDAMALLAATGEKFSNLDEAFAGIRMSRDDVNMGMALANLSPDRPTIFLDLDEEHFDGGFVTAQDLVSGDLSPFEAAVPYSKILEAVTITLDPLTIVDDANYIPIILDQLNLPSAIKDRLPAYYGFTTELPDEFQFFKDEPNAARFVNATDLATVLKQPGFLTVRERLLLVQQALLVLERIYVHLPLKRSMHAIDPVQRLRLLQFELEEQARNGAEALASELDFHRAMLNIFTSLRDLHTSYALPFPYRGKVAFLPFLIEEYYDDPKEPAHYIISKVAGKIKDRSFKKNVEVLYWNGIPIRRAIELNADRHAGSNPAARYARGLDSLTIRPLTYVLPPDEEWVTITYRTEDDRIREFTQKWLVYTPTSNTSLFEPDDSDQVTATARGVDSFTDAVQHVKGALYAPGAVEADKRVKQSGLPQTVSASTIQLNMPTVFRAREVNETCGYIRIFNFDVDDANAFVDEFVRLAQQLPQQGLILDIRGNPGGLIHAAERLLQVLPHEGRIEPSRAQFINSNLILQLCELHSPSRAIRDFSLRDWIASIRQAVRTGAVYSQAIPITEPETCNVDGLYMYRGKVVLIVDAICYSAADIFAAGFQDHHIGKIVGVSDNTGAGGANVWNYELLRYLMTDPAAPQNNVFKPLPRGADMSIAIRRTLRVGDQAGTPLEDLGISIPQKYRHHMRREDLLGSNDALINFASEVLAEDW